MFKQHKTKLLIGGVIGSGLIGTGFWGQRYYYNHQDDIKLWLLREQFIRADSIEMSDAIAVKLFESRFDYHFDREPTYEESQFCKSFNHSRDGGNMIVDHIFEKQLWTKKELWNDPSVIKQLSWAYQTPERCAEILKIFPDFFRKMNPFNDHDEIRKSMNAMVDSDLRFSNYERKRKTQFENDHHHNHRNEEHERHNLNRELDKMNRQRLGTQLGVDKSQKKRHRTEMELLQMKTLDLLTDEEKSKIYDEASKYLIKQSFLDDLKRMTQLNEILSRCDPKINQDGFFDLYLRGRTINGENFNKFYSHLHPIVITQDHKNNDGLHSGINTRGDDGIKFTIKKHFLQDYDKNECSHNTCYVWPVTISAKSSVRINRIYDYYSKEIELGQKIPLPRDRKKAIEMMDHSMRH